MAFRGSTVRIDKGALRRLSNAQVRALEQTAEALHTEIVQAQVMPRDTGAMQNERTFVDHSNASKGTCSIVTTSPQARRLYYHPEYHYSKEENANAGGRWFEPWMPGGKKENFAKKAFAEFCRKEMGT